jgi:putative acetyltransferase
MNLVVREETKADIPAITEVTIAAFKTLVVSNQTEHHIISALRNAGVLTLSLVALVEDQVVGHIAFSPVTMSDGALGWYGLGPVSV